MCQLHIQWLCLRFTYSCGAAAPAPASSEYYFAAGRPPNVRANAPNICSVRRRATSAVLSRAGRRYRRAEEETPLNLSLIHI